MRKTGELFILRTNINTVGSVLDSPVCSLRVCVKHWPLIVFAVGGILGMYIFLPVDIFVLGGY